MTNIETLKSAITETEAEIDRVETDNRTLRRFVRPTRAVVIHDVDADRGEHHAHQRKTDEK